MSLFPPLPRCVLLFLPLPSLLHALEILFPLSLPSIFPPIRLSVFPTLRRSLSPPLRRSTSPLLRRSTIPLLLPIMFPLLLQSMFPLLRRSMFLLLPRRMSQLFYLLLLSISLSFQFSQSLQCLPYCFFRTLFFHSHVIRYSELTVVAIEGVGLSHVDGAFVDA